MDYIGSGYVADKQMHTPATDQLTGPIENHHWLGGGMSPQGALPLPELVLVYVYGIRENESVYSCICRLISETFIVAPCGRMIANVY